MIYETIKIEKDLVPYSFDIMLGDESFEIRIDYNESHGFFTAELAKDGETTCAGEKIVYGKPLFEDVFVHDKFPNIRIVPFDISGESSEVTYDNLSDTVNLIIDNQEISVLGGE